MNTKKDISDRDISKIAIAVVIIFFIIGLIFEIKFNKSMNKTFENSPTITGTTIILEVDDEGQTQYGILEQSTKETVTEVSTKNDAVISFSNKPTIVPTSIINPTLYFTTIETSSKTSGSIFDSIVTTARDLGNAFYYDDGEAVYITAEEYYIICGVVMNEAGANWGSYEGRIAVAQAIRNQIIKEKRLGNPYDIASIRKKYQEYYTKKPSDDVRKAVTDVFYNHIVVTTEFITAWCATDSVGSWHTSQYYICSYGGNNFYVQTTDVKSQ